MPLLDILLVFVIVGVALWLINTYAPMQSTVKTLMNAVVIIFLVFWILNIFGLLDSLRTVRVPVR